MEDIETVYQAIECLNGSVAEQSSAAAKWLSEFQGTLGAWRISDELLQHNRHYQAAYFGAQTIRTKILKDFRELPPESYESLRDSLVQHLKRVEALNPDEFAVIVTQLALALADLYLQVPEWIGIADIVNLFNAADSDGSLNILLSLLRVFPEELSSRYLKLGANRRSAVQQEFATHFDTVINLLSHILQTHQNNPNLVKKLMQCVGPWINNPLNDTDNFASSTLFQSMLAFLNNTNAPADIYECICEALCSACLLCEDTTRHAKLASVMQQGMYSTVNTFKALVALEDFEKLASLARVYVELAESLLEECVNNPDKPLGDLRTIELLIFVVEYHDFSLTEMTFNVWYRMSEFLFQVTDDDFYTHLLNQFRPIIEQFIMCLYRHCQLDVDFVGVPDEKDDFVEFRKRASESIKDVSFIIGTQNLLKNMLHLITSDTNPRWNELESAIFIASMAVGNVPGSEETMLPHLLTIIFSMPEQTHVALLNTSVELVGNVPEWLEEHQEMLPKVFKWLIGLSSQEHLLKSAAESIENIARINYVHLREYFPDLLVFLQRAQKAAFKSPMIESAALAMLRSCAILLNDMNGAYIAEQLTLLCRDSLERLEMIATVRSAGHSFSTNENDWNQVSTDPLVWLDRVTAVFKALKPWNNQLAFQEEHNKTNGAPDQIPPCPWVTLGTQVCQSVALAIQAYQDNYRIVEHACRCSRYIIRSMGIQAVMFVGELATLTLQVYKAHPHSCFLYLASVLVDEYAAFAEVLPQLINLGEVIASRSFVLFHEPQGFRNNPDTIDDLFRLAIRFVQRCPAAFFSQPFSRQLFECGLFALEVDHNEAHRSVTKFYIETLCSIKMAKSALNQYPAVEAVESLFREHGQQLVWHSLSGALFFVNNSLKKDIADVLFEAMTVYRELFTTWLSNAVQRLAHEHRLGATVEQLQNFHTKVLASTRTNELTAHLKDLCKLYS
uniref:Importin N-terminal domain-containing protein n=1 Tax=Panagrellus redivivus TaxID=6233 RepID=A0A7E4VZI7_PANRE